jgi:type II secretory pathway pseudopilin PulG
MTPLRAPTSFAPNRRRRGFTLVELMVAITGGLFVSLAVFAIARESGRFYNRESRMSDANLSVVLGFERLKADIGRAGFLGTPNVLRDPHLCGTPLGGGWPTLMQRLAALRITREGSQAVTSGNATLAQNNLKPDAILLMGSYTGSEEFPIWNVQNNGANYVVYLQQNMGPLARLGYATSTDQLGLLNSVFGAGRALRIQDQSGEIQFGTIASVVAGVQPQVILSQTPVLQFRGTAGSQCGLKGNVTGATVNVVNFVQYDIRNIAQNSNFGGTNLAYEPLYDGGAGDPRYEPDRTDLVRVELDSNGAPITGTEEVVAEYAVDLKFGITVANNPSGPYTDPTFQQFDFDDPVIPNWAGDLIGDVADPGTGPQRVRDIRVRLAVRSQEPDREAAPVTPGQFFRMALGNGANAPPFARVRTLQADIAMNNQMGVFY